jgi:hypothetical protein
MVVDDPDEAKRLLRVGLDVVLLLDVGAPSLGLGVGGPGRLAVLVGPISDPASWDAARAMARELFGAP